MEQRYKFELEPLPYAHDALEPYIDKETLHFHHDKHLQTYVDNLNKALADYPRFQDRSLSELISHQEQLPDAIRTAVRNNAGGVYNHNMYFKTMAPAGTTKLSGALAEAIDRSFESYDNFIEKLKAAALGQFGSGWAWLATDKGGNLQIVNTPNQDTPLTMGLCPLLLVDVWEHAYYLKYQNRRPEYFDNWTQVINWDEVAKNYDGYRSC